MVVGHDGLQGASDDFGEKRDKTAMLFNENFPGKNITMTLKKLSASSTVGSLRV